MKLTMIPIYALYKKKCDTNDIKTRQLTGSK